MRAVAIFAVLLVVSLAAPFDEVKAIVKNDVCAASSMELIQPEITIQIQKLKQVKIYLIEEPRRFGCQS